MWWVELLVRLQAMTTLWSQAAEAQVAVLAITAGAGALVDLEQAIF
jgi:hypothetical protein